MDTRFLIGTGALFMAGGIATFVGYQLLYAGKSRDFRSLMGTGEGNSKFDSEGISKTKGAALDLDKINEDLRKKVVKKKKATVDDLFFQAGMFSKEDRTYYQRLKIILPIVFAVFGQISLSYFGGFELGILGLVLGILCGLQGPRSILDRKIKARAEDTLFYLPLVIEQISIGVSSSLDIGPCLERLVAMADERDTHNAVTELIRSCQQYVRSGVPLPDALNEVGRLSGQAEVKHAFMSLAQVVRHGGEISRQLQELADAVSAQRETKIEERIKKLELEATGPVGLVFVGFMVILLVGFGIQIQKAFG